MRKSDPSANMDVEWTSLPEPKLPVIKGTYNIVLTGVGGTGILTLGALLGMAAHIEKKGVGILDMIGLAQKRRCSFITFAHREKSGRYSFTKDCLSRCRFGDRRRFGGDRRT